MRYSIITMLLTSLFLFGCAQDELIAEQEENQNQEVYTVSLKFNGDIQTEDSPLSRAETDSRDLYGIQVYRDGNYFAAGMFDNTNDITINLLAGSSYKFVCTAIKEGKDKLYKYCSSSTSPFSYNSNIKLSCNNSFTYTVYPFYNLESDYVSMAGSSSSYYRCRNVDRFYGELSDYTPSVDGIVNLELKRVSFGLKLKVTNLQEGEVSVTCKNDYNTFVSASGLTTDYETEAAVYSMANVYDAWQYADTGYTEALTLSLTWSRSGGLISNTWTKTVQVKRNAMNTIRIKMSTDEKEDIGVGVTPEEGEMGEEEEEEIPLG